MSTIVETVVAAATAPVQAVTEASESVAEADTEVVAPAAETVAPATPAPAAPAVDEKTNSRFAALSRQEKALREQTKAIAAEKAQLAKDRAELESSVKGKMIDTEEFKRNPYKYMKDHGITLESLAEIALNDGKPTTESVVGETEKRMMTKMAELEKRLADKEAAEAEANQAKVLQEFMGNLTKQVNDNPADYELIIANDAVDVVYEVIEAHFEKELAAYIDANDEEPDAETRNSFILSNKDACDKVEKYFLDEATKQVKLKKIQGLLTPPATTAKPTVKAQTTLTNAAASAATTTGTKKLSDEESKLEAAKLIKWE